MRFYLGTHRPYWLWREKDVPFFVSRRTLGLVKKIKPANMSWALDSGGFSELSLNGKWTVEESKYFDEVLRWNKEIGNLDFACIQDWMCEPWILGKTGLSIKEHQQLTIDSYISLQKRDIKKEVTWLPILQGWGLEDYLAHINMYEAHGIDLTKENRVGVGSVCRRQHTDEILNILKTISGLGIKIHAFGIKILGLKKVKNLIDSADSMSWSYQARYDKPLPVCQHKNCSNCIKYAKNWYLNKILTI
jgi:hypothetical protein